jgi:tetratricopeptide (TPR) repeat protein
MKISLPTSGGKWLFAALVFVLVIAYLGLTATRFAASWFDDRGDRRADLRSLQRAVRLDPGNADYRYDLGRYYDLVAHDQTAAIPQYQAAVALNPHSADYWRDMAFAYWVREDTAHQTAALEHAIEAEPTKPEIARTAANFYLVLATNEKDPATEQSLSTKALREFRVVLTNDPPSAPEAIQNCWRLRPDVDLLLRDVIPPTADAYIPFLAFLENDVDRQVHEVASVAAKADSNNVITLSQIQNIGAQIHKETAAAFKVWNALVQSGQPFEQRYASDYLTFLIQHGEVDQAVHVWQETTDHFKLSSYLPSPGNLIVNGQLSLPVLNTGFDWRYQKQNGVKLALDPIDPKEPHGPRYLRITFDGPGISDAGFYQLVPVQAGTTYDFSAHYRNEGQQEGAGGPHFTVQDMYSQAIYYESDVLKSVEAPQDGDDVKDTESRKTVNGEFTTSPTCKLLVVHIRRVPEGHPIRGKLWVDDFRLVKKPA